MRWTRRIALLCTVLLCTGALLAVDNPAAKRKAVDQPAQPAELTANGKGAVPHGTASIPESKKPEDLALDSAIEQTAPATDWQKEVLDGGPRVATKADALEAAKREELMKQGWGDESAGDMRACDDCLTPNMDLGDIGFDVWGYSVSGDCATEGKWYASFNGYAGNIYHFDMCNVGTASSDVDIKITDSTCAILDGQDGSSSCSWHPDNFTWTCPADGVYYVVIAPYRSYNQHNCAGDATDTFTMYYYAEGDPCEGVTPPVNDDCSSVGTPVVLAEGVPETFVGDNTCATNDGGSCFGPVGETWEAFTLTGSATGWDVVLDYCATTDGYGASYYHFALDCPCSSYVTADHYDWTTCPNGNFTAEFSELADGTYYFPVAYSPEDGAAGPYTITVVATVHVPAYCESTATSTADETIKQVVLNTIDNTTTDCDLYDDFTALSTDVAQNVTYPLTLVIGDCEGTSCYSKRAAVFIDYNQDMDFDDPGERVYNSGALGNSPCPDYTINTNIMISTNSLLGCTRMRVVVREGSTDPSPCGTYTWGATEDYTVCIQPQPETGACCLGDMCLDGGMTDVECINTGGVFQGGGTTCDPNPCVGACCFPDGSCSVLTEDDCAAATGSYSGGGTDCDPNLCPAPGDACSNPVEITAVPFVTQFDNDEALPGAPSCNSSYSVTQNDWWFTYTPAEDCYIVLDVAEVTSYDMVMGIYTGPDCNNLTNIDCLDDPEPYHVEFEATGGTTYWFQIGDYGSGEGGGLTDFSLDCGAVPSGACCFPDTSCAVMTANECVSSNGTYQGNDTVCEPGLCPLVIDAGEDCPVAYDIPSVPFDVVFDNDTYAAGTPAGSCNSSTATTMQNDGWLSYTPTQECLLDFSFASPDYDAIAAIYSGPDCDNLTEITCIDTPDDPGTYQMIATTGTTYWFQIGDWGSSEGGGVTPFSLDCVVGPGACCFLDGSCQETDPIDCIFNLGGDYSGDGTTCTPNECPQPQLGDNCDVPIVVDLTATLPYSDTNGYTCGRNNNYDETCLGYYDGGEDVIYQLDVTGDAMCVAIDVQSNTTENWIGVGVDTACPLGGACLAAVGTSTTHATIDGLVLVPGTYYMMIDTWPSPPCLHDYDLTITPSDACNFGACCGYPGQGCVEVYEEECIAVGGIFLGDDTTCSTLDCNNNGIDDACDIAGGTSPDCNGNAVPDECDLAQGTSLDVDVNGVPDECQPDCNTNGVLDLCDVDCNIGECASYYPNLCGLSEDCQGNGVPDECELGKDTVRATYIIDDGSSEDGLGITAGADLAALVQYNVLAGGGKITSVSIAWGSTYDGIPATVYVWNDPNQDGSPADAQVLASASTVTANSGLDIFTEVVLPTPANIGPEGTSFFVGFILNDNQYPIALDQTAPVSGRNWIVGSAYATPPIDPNDLGSAAYNVPLDTTEGNGFPGNLMIRAEGVQGGGGDCNTNGVPDECDVPPICDPQVEACSLDCNNNLIPDECEIAVTDCNNNGIPDDCDIDAGVSLDCNSDGIPDECQLDGNDCNNDGVPDDCQLADNDCNGNNIPDDCDIASGVSEDCQPDGVPDECQLGPFHPGGNLVQDPSFEAGTPNSYWTEYSLQFGTPLCTVADCGTGTGTGPHTGTWWTWFGGYPYGYEEGYVQQTLVIPTGSTTLTFWLEAIVCDSVSDYMVASIDGNEVFSIDGGSALCGQLGYQQQVVDISAYADGASHVLEFYSETFANAAGPSNFFIDDVEISGVGAPPDNDCNLNNVPDECDIAGDTSHDYNANEIPDECEEICGDWSGPGGDPDNAVDQWDYWFFLDCFGTCDPDPKYRVQADFDEDGCITAVDYQYWLLCYRAFVGDPLALPPSKPRPPGSQTGEIQKPGLPGTQPGVVPGQSQPVVRP